MLVNEDVHAIGVEDGTLIFTPFLGSELRDLICHSLSLVIDGSLSLLAAKRLVESTTSPLRKDVRERAVDRVKLPAVEADASLRSNDANKAIRRFVPSRSRAEAAAYEGQRQGEPAGLHFR